MILAKNIRYLRKQRGFSQDYLAEKLGYKSYTTIQKWEMGTSEPPLKKLRKLATLFHVDIDDLTGVDLEKNGSSVSAPPGVKIPIYGYVAAGIPIDAIEDIIDVEEISQEMARTGDFFGLRIKGDSMEPRIENGDVVIVRKQNDADNGDIVIALINGDEGVCKKLVKHSSGISLVSFNPAYEPMYFSSQEVIEMPVTIIGKVKELRAKF